MTAAQWIAQLWFIGAGWFALFALFKAVWINRRLKHLRQPASGELATEVKQLAQRLGLRAAPAVWLLDGIAQPFVWGLLRGEIYLPSKFADAAAPQDRRGILTHELAHVSRWDAAVNALQVLVQAAFFFHPLIWWANRKVRQEREKCCDEMAIAALAARPQQYGEAIVDVLVRQHETRMPVPSLAVAGPVKNIEERIRTIMRPDRRFYARPTWIAIITVAALAAISVPTGVLLTARAGAENGPPDSQAGPTSGQFTVTLPNGVTVELLAVHDIRRGGWWRPDGTELESPLYASVSRSRHAERYQFELVLRTNVPRDSSRGWKIDADYSVGIGHPKDGAGNEIKDLRVCAIGFGDSVPTAMDAGYGVAMGQWEKLGTYRAHRDGEPNWSLTVNNLLLFRTPTDDPQDDELTVLDIVYRPIPDVATRVVAITKSGREIPAHTGGSTGLVVTLRTCKFRVRLDEIDRFEFYTRAYETAIFGNVSLRPGSKTKVQVQVQAAPTPGRDARSGFVVKEGVGIGEAVVGATVQGILDAFGSPDKRTDKPHVWLQYHKSVGIDILFFDGRAGEIRFNKGFIYPLSGGPRIGTHMDEVLTAYGKPIRTEKANRNKGLFADRVLYQLPKAWKISYSKQGVLFWFDKKKRVTQFVVFKVERKKG